MIPTTAGLIMPNHIAFEFVSADRRPCSLTFNQTGRSVIRKTSIYKQIQLFYSDGYIQIVLTDARAVLDADKKFRSAVVLIDSSGRVEVCPRVIVLGVLCASINNSFSFLNEYEE